MSPGIDVLLVEDHPVVLHGLRAMCTAEQSLEVVGEATGGPDALSAVQRLRPDVVVVPVRLDGSRSGIELCRSIKSVSEARVVVFTSFTRVVDVQVAALAGADALISKLATPEVFVDALLAVVAGRRQVFLGPRSGPSAATEDLFPAELLTPREQEILRLVLEGLTNPEIATRLTIEISTVKTHMRSILRRLGVGTRRDLL